MGKREDWEDSRLWERIVRRQGSENPHWQSPKMREIRHGLYYESDTACQREDFEWRKSVPGEAPTTNEHRNFDVELVSTLLSMDNEPGWWRGGE